MCVRVCVGIHQRNHLSDLPACPHTHTHTRKHTDWRWQRLNSVLWQLWDKVSVFRVFGSFSSFECILFWPEQIFNKSACVCVCGRTCLCVCVCVLECRFLFLSLATNSMLQTDRGKALKFYGKCQRQTSNCSLRVFVWALCFVESPSGYGQQLRNALTLEIEPRHNMRQKNIKLNAKKRKMHIGKKTKRRKLINNSLIVCDSCVWASLVAYYIQLIVYTWWFLCYLCF